MLSTVMNILVYVLALICIGLILLYVVTLQRNRARSERRDHLLSIVNSASVILLRTNIDRFDRDLYQCMGMFGEALGVERVSIWRNSTVDGKLCTSRIYEWTDSDGAASDLKHTLDVPYCEIVPGWEKILSEGNCVNSLVRDMPPVEQAHLAPLGLKTVFATPVFIEDRFWGYIGYCNCKDGRVIRENEQTIMQSGGSLVANAFLRNLQAVEIRKAHERAKLLLDATPLACRLWNKEHKVIELNEAAVKLFKTDGKQEIINNYFAMSPERQPDGQSSREKTHQILDKVFEEGSAALEWQHITKDGEEFPTEISLVRLDFGGETLVAGYTRDLREQKELIRDLEKRDKLLKTINDISGLLLQSEINSFARDLYQCMVKLGMAVGVDNITIWKNHLRNNALYYSKVFEWRDGANLPESKGYMFETEFNEANQFSYSEIIPGWEETLSGGNCINMLVRDMPPESQVKFTEQGVLSVFTTPVFINDNFWGFVGYDNYSNAQSYSEDEQLVLRSGGLVIASAILRNEMMLNIRDTSVKLEDALKDAQNANDAKSDFLAKMSHEMRTPLNAVIGLSGLSLDAGKLDTDDKANLEQIYNAGTTLLGTVNDILDISKIEAGRLELAEAAYDVPSLINDAVTQNILRIGDKPIELRLDVDENLYARLGGDELRVKQIINNLLSNAIKYTEDGFAELSIRCVNNPQSEQSEQCDQDSQGRVFLIIKVSDTGRGIKPEDLGKLFSDYSQIDAISNRTIEGTGLGLPITKMLAELMGGSISVESDYGKGSVFTVKIAQRFISGAAIGPEVVESLRNFRYSDGKRNRITRLRRISLPYARVLLVDDNVTNLEVAKGLMKPYGMQIDCVTSGQMSVEAMRSENVRYNAVFMDHMMPGMDGVEAAVAIRQIGTEYAESVPIIMLTANAIVGNEEMYLSKGFQAFLSKPIDIARLDEVIKRWVRDKSQEEDYSGILPPVSKDDKDVFDENNRRYMLSRRSGIDRRKANMQYAGLDIDKGIERFSGDREVYFKVISSYVTHTRQLLDSLVDTSKDKLDAYAITVHGIKGSSRGIFADMISDAAENLEMAARNGDYTYISAHNETFLNAAWRLIFDLEDLLANVSSDSPKQVKDKPDADTLSKLLHACEVYNMDEVDEAMTELEKYAYDTGGEFADWLVENIKLMNFREIVERLSDAGGEPTDDS